MSRSNRPGYPLRFTIDGEDLPLIDMQTTDTLRAIDFAQSLVNKGTTEVRIWREWPEGPGGRELMAVIRGSDGKQSP